MDEEKRKARAVGSKAALMVAALFFGFLVAGIIAVALGLSYGSNLLAAVCIGPFLAGFLIAAAYYIRTKHVSGETFTLALDVESVRPGDRLSGTVAVHPTRPIRLRSIEARILGAEKTSVTVNYGKYSTTYTQEVPWVDKALDLVPQGLAAMGGIQRPEGEPLPPGEYLHRFEFEIPEDAIPSWSGTSAKTRCLVKVRVDIERGLDAIQETELHVLPKRRRPERVPSTFGSERGLQVSLESRELGAGGILLGRIVLVGIDAAKVREIRVRFIEQEWAVARGHQAKHRKTLAETVLPAPTQDFQTIPFQLAVPPDARPSISGAISRLQHLVQVHANIALGRDAVAEGPLDILVS